MDTSTKGLEAMRAFVQKASIPEGTDEWIKDSGYIGLEPGDCLLVRDKNNQGDEDQDEMVCWITPEACFDPDDVAELMAVRDDILGSQDKRTRKKAEDQDEAWIGGVAWERDEHAVCVDNAERCYNLAASFQSPRQLTVPYSVMLKGAPAEETALLRKRAEALNFPWIGSREIYYFSTMQLNLSPAQGPDAAKANDLGHFGGKHTDNHDAPMAYSHLLCCSDLLGGEDPGIFVILTFGIYLCLGGVASCCFSGRHNHGGFPPTAQPGTNPHPGSYRVVVVSYPTDAAFDCVGKYTLAKLGNGAAIELPKEARDPEAIVQLAQRVLQEVSPELEVSLDTDAVLKAITYRDPDSGNRVALDPWELFECAREDVSELWAEVFQHKLPFFPELMDTHYWEKYMDAGPDPSGKAQPAGPSLQKAPRSPSRKKRAVTTESESQQDSEYLPSGSRQMAKKGKKPQILSKQVYHRLMRRTGGQTDILTSPAEDNNMDIDDNQPEVTETDTPYEDLGSLTLETSEINPNWPYAKLLETFTYSSLLRYSKELGKNVRALEKQELDVLQSFHMTGKVIHPILHQSSKPFQYTADYASQLASLWKFSDIHYGKLNFMKVQIAMLQCEYMLAIAAAWTWLDIDIPSYVLGYLKGTIKPKGPTAWLCRLANDVLEQYKKKTHSFSSHLGRIAQRADLQHEAVLKEVRHILGTWLVFPAGQSNLQGHFVRHIINAFHTSDILLLPGVFKAFERVHETVFRKKSGQSIRAARRSPADLDPFLLHLKKQPLSLEDSQEYQLMQNISSKLDEYRNAWRRISGVQDQSSADAVTAYVRGSPEFNEAMESATTGLVEFLRDLLPLLSTPLPNTLSVLQRKVYNNLDFLLPFRQHAPEVQNIFSSHGFLHPDNVNLPGAIANFDAWRTLHDNLSRDPQIQAYNQGKDGDRYFCNPRTYGQATTRSVTNAKAYFATEDSWLERFEREGEGWQMGYKAAYLFSQQSTRKEGKQSKLLPQIGPLSGMLITSDLVYAGKVAMPSAKEMGEMVHLLNKGADACLQHFHLLEKGGSLDETQVVFETLYNKVHSELIPDELYLMTFDPIMFEHSLCKFQCCYDD
ncbi:hypothetical protein FKP32DRAFT_1674557 [Trametes sanguinea]|nr:hypothetical protein FKP32DRAFT_1674557 [Trametes sanguinea]